MRWTLLMVGLLAGGVCAAGSLGCASDDEGATGGAGAAGMSAGGTAGNAGAGGAGATAGAGGAGAPLFSDEFDAPNSAWQFDMTEPGVSYQYDGGALVVTAAAGSQAFAYLAPDPSWPATLAASARFRIESGMVGGVMLRSTSFPIANAVNCNLREDLQTLRAARHSARTYITVQDAPFAVLFNTEYQVHARLQGSSLDCSVDGGPSVSAQLLPDAQGGVGLFVYSGVVRFESFELVGP